MTGVGVNPAMRLRGRNLRRVALLLLALVAIGIASAKLLTAFLPRSFSMGTLTGTLQTVGGPSGSGPRPRSGMITAKTSNRGVLTFPVGASGHFSVQAVVGTYTVTARVPQYGGGTVTCHASGPVTVRKGVTSTVKVDCQER